MSALRELLAVFTTEFDGKGIKDGEKGINSLKSGLLDVGKALVAGLAIDKIVEFGREILEQADVLAKQSIALSASAAELQGWQWAAKLSGSSAEEFNSAFTKFNRNVAEAAKGTGPAADALKEFGITAADLKSKTPIQLLDDLADGLDGVQDPAKRTAAFMALFGKSGAKLLPLFLEGKEGIKKLRAEVDELGFSFDEAFLKDAQEVNDNVDRLKNGFKGLAIQGLKPLLPYITELTKGGVELVKGLVHLAKTSNVVKVGLLAFGGYGMVKAVSSFTMLAQKAGFLKSGLRGLFLELLPLVAAFLVAEDVFTFFSDANSESLTGDLIERFFGKDGVAKVRLFADDLMAAFRDIFAIFTDGKPLDTKFRELYDYINGTLRPQFKADFGDMGNDIAMVITAAGVLAETITKIGDAMKWVGKATEWLSGNTIGRALFAAGDADADEDARAARRRESGDSGSYDSLRGLLAPSSKDVNAMLERSKKARPDPAREAARNNAILGATPGKRATAEDYGGGGWLKEVISAAVGISSQDVADAINKGVATAYLPTASYAAPVNQSLVQNVTQNITADTPAELKRAASKGAKEGLTEGGEYLRTQRALVPRPGG